MEYMIEELLEALKPFAYEAAQWEHFDDEERLVEGWTDGPDSRITVGDLRKAHTIFKSLEVK